MATSDNFSISDYTENNFKSSSSKSIILSNASECENENAIFHEQSSPKRFELESFTSKMNEASIAFSLDLYAKANYCRKDVILAIQLQNNFTDSILKVIMSGLLEYFTPLFAIIK